MTDSAQAPGFDRHKLNNLLSKILGAAELALDVATEADVRSELETIIRLAEDGGAMLASMPHPDREA